MRVLNDVAQKVISRERVFGVKTEGFRDFIFFVLLYVRVLKLLFKTLVCFYVFAFVVAIALVIAHESVCVCTCSYMYLF